MGLIRPGCSNGRISCPTRKSLSSALPSLRTQRRRGCGQRGLQSRGTELCGAELDGELRTRPDGCDLPSNQMLSGAFCVYRLRCAHMQQSRSAWKARCSPPYLIKNRLRLLLALHLSDPRRLCLCREPRLLKPPLCFPRPLYILPSRLLVDRGHQRRRRPKRSLRSFPFIAPTSPSSARLRRPCTRPSSLAGRPSSDLGTPEGAASAAAPPSAAGESVAAHTALCCPMHLLPRAPAAFGARRQCALVGAGRCART